MNIRYWWIVITYILVQFSVLLGVPLLLSLGVSRTQAFGIWSIFSFTIGLVIILILLIPDIRERHLVRGRSTRGEAIRWSLIGIALVFGAQYAAALIESVVLGIEPGSQNTQDIVEIAKAFPAFILIVSIIGPILEEIVFRKVLFGALYKRFNFGIAALVSSLIFAVVHMDFIHLLIYTAMGFAFAFLYVKTKRIIVPIIAHVSINLFVAVVQVVFADQLEEMIENLEQTASIIFGGIL